MADCDICLEPTNKTKKKLINCPYCKCNLCSPCLKKYLLEDVSPEPKCPSCNAVFNRHILLSMFPTSFLIKDYKLHREKVLLDSEKSKLPEAQIYAEKYIEAKKYIDDFNKIKLEKELILKGTVEYEDLQKAQKEYNDFYEKYRGKIFNDQKLFAEYKILTQNIALAKHKLHQTNEYKEFKKSSSLSISHYNRSKIVSTYGKYEPVPRHGEADKPKEREKRFIKACPIKDCRGFLSTAYKCGICNSHICKDCNEQKKDHKDDEHVCDPDKVASMKVIASETTPCPKCAVPIFKISGCFAENTPILKYDGSIVMSQDIKIGDILIGDDGLPRNVESLMSGYDNLYEVQQNNGMTYIVNSKHLLALKSSSNFDEIVEIPIDSYLSLHNSEKDKLKGYKLTDKDNKKYLLSDIDVELVGYDKYYGWSVDKNKRFLLADATVVRNCSQVWCTNCHTAFDHKTGIIDTGVIHNPHYFEWMRKNNMTVPANANNIIQDACGGINWRINDLLIQREILARITKDENYKYFKVLLERYIYLTHTIATTRRSLISSVRRFEDINKKDKFKVLYLTKQIDENKWKYFLQRDEKGAAREKAKLQLLEMFIGAARQIYDEVHTNSVFNPVKIVEDLNNLMKFVNEQSQYLLKDYQNTTPGCDYNWNDDLWTYISCKKEKKKSTKKSSLITHVKDDDSELDDDDISDLSESESITSDKKLTPKGGAGL